MPTTISLSHGITILINQSHRNCYNNTIHQQVLSDRQPLIAINCATTEIYLTPTKPTITGEVETIERATTTNDLLLALN